MATKRPWHHHALIALAVVGGGTMLVAAGASWFEELSPATYPRVVRQPVTAAEAQAFAETFVADLADCQPARLAAHLDRPAVVDGLLRGIQLRLADRAAVEAIVEKLPSAWCTTMGGAGARVLRVRPTPAGARPLIRLGGDRIDYVELDLASSSAGVGLVDLRLFSQGFSTVEAFAAGGTLYDAGRADRDLEVAVTALKRGDAPAARRVRAALPPAAAASPLARMLALEATADLDREAFDAALTAFNRDVPGRAVGDLRALVRFDHPSTYPRLLAAIDRLTALLGGDPVLDALAAAVHLEQGDVATAHRLAAAAARAAPEDLRCWRALLRAQLAAGDLQAVPATLTEMHTRFDVAVDAASLRRNTDYALGPFLGSPVGQAWAADNP